MPLLAASLAALLLALPAAAPASPEGEQAIVALNQQRAAHGLPAAVTEIPDWSAACAQHVGYLAANGGTLTHDEDPAKPGYSESGAWAGRNAVLSTAGTWGPGEPNPWENAPIHLMQTLSPLLTQAGFAPGCLTTWPGYRARSAQGVLYSYPANGTAGWPFEQAASESPFTPGDHVGLPQGTTTGPHLYLMADARRGRLEAATLTGPQGPVDIRTVDNTTPQVGGYLPPGGIVIPVAPLIPGATYALSTRFVENGTNPQTLPVTTGFTTRKIVPTFTVGLEDGVLAYSPEPSGSLGFAARITVVRLPSGTLVYEEQADGPREQRLPVPGGQYRLCAAVPASMSFEPAEQCVEARWRTDPGLRVTRGRRAVVISPGAAAGRRARLLIRTRNPWRTRTRWLTLPPRPLRVAVKTPSSVTVSVRAFRTGEQLFFGSERRVSVR